MTVNNNFVYVVVCLSVVYFSTTILKATTSHIFAVVVCYLLLSRLKQGNEDENLKFNKDIDDKLSVIGNPKFFYLDVNLINLYFSIYKWKSFNPHSFNESIKASSNVLRFKAEKVARCVDKYEIALEQSKIALNMLHSFVYSIDNRLLIEKLKKVLVRLQQLLARHLQDISTECKSDLTVDIHTRYIEDSDGPKGFDASATPFDFF